MGTEVAARAAVRPVELELMQRRFGADFEAAFRRTFEALAPRDRTLLRYQVIDRLGIDRIATIYGIHRATAARWVAHAREALVEGVRRTLQAQFHIGTEELDSLLRLVQSRLELSLQLLLPADPE
jgi:RNA polymerase sigma-70 factor (ECF subfamily)